MERGHKGMGTWVKEQFSFQDLQRLMFKLLEHVDIFAGLTQKELLHLLESSEKCSFDPGEAIVREGSIGAYLYVIIGGQVSVVKSGKYGQGSELARLGAGETFGEMSLVDQEARSASVIAQAPCVLMRIGEAQCWQDPATSAKLFRNMARIVSRRLREMDEAYLYARR